MHEGRDLAITTDFRLVLAEVLERDLRLPDAWLEDVLPQFGVSGRSALGLIRV